jgi:hypothetical protein
MPLSASTTWKAIGGSVIGVAIVALIISLNYPVTEDTYYCADEPANLRECPWGISGGIGTRCYTNLIKNTWDYCRTGWLRALDYVYEDTEDKRYYIIDNVAEKKDFGISNINLTNHINHSWDGKEAIIELKEKAGIDSFIKRTSKWGTSYDGYPMYTYDESFFGQNFKKDYVITLKVCVPGSKGRGFYKCNDLICLSRTYLGNLDTNDCYTRFGASTYVIGPDGSSVNLSIQNDTQLCVPNEPCFFDAFYLNTTNHTIDDGNCNLTISNGSILNMTLLNEPTPIQDQILLYRMNNVSGLENRSHIYDYSGSGNNGTGLNFDDGDIEAGKFNLALHFDNNDDYIDVGEFDDIEGADYFTICSWVYLDTLGSGESADSAIFAKSDGSNPLIFWYNYNQSGYGQEIYTFNFGPTATSANKVHTPPNSAKAQTWQFVCAVKDNTIRRIYLDGDLSGTSTGATGATVPTNTENGMVGYWDGAASSNFYADGLLDDVSIWTRVLTQKEISEIYTRQKANHTFPNEGNYEANITCIHSTYDSVNTSESFYVSIPPRVLQTTPSNASGFEQDIFNITISGNSTDLNLNKETLVFVKNDTEFDTNNSLIFISKEDVSIVNISYNLTALPYPYDDDMVLWLHFDNRSEYWENSTYVHDFTRYGNNVTVGDPIDNTWSNDGKFAGNFNYDGVDDATDALWVDDKPTLDTEDEFTIALWFYWDSDHETSVDDQLFHRGVVYGNNYNTNYRMFIDDSSGDEIEAAFGDGSSTECHPTGSTVTPGMWHHAAMVYNGSHIILYMDGYEDTNTACSHAPYVAGDQRLNFGLQYATNTRDKYFDGRIDEFAIWNRSLSLSEIKDLYRLKNGTYYMKTIATDTAGDSNESMVEFYIGESPELPGAVDNAPEVTLNKPVDDYSDDNDPAITTINCSATDGEDLVNLSIWTTDKNNDNFKLNTTFNIDGSSNTSFSIEVSPTFSGGQYTWNCEACDNASQCSFAPANYTFTIGTGRYDCYNATVAGTTYVHQNDFSSTDTCIHILAHNITIDMNGYNITGDGSADDYAIYNDGYIISIHINSYIMC